MEPYTPERVSEINAAREANVSAGLPATSGAGATPLSISSQTLAATKPVEIPTPQPQISPVVALAAKAQAGQDAYKQAEEQVAKANQGVDNIQQKKQGILDYLGLGEKKAQGFYTEAQNALTTQVDPAQKELNDIRSKESDVLVQYRADTDAIKARGDISAEAQQGLQFNADDKYGRVLADLAIRKAAQIQNVTDLRQAIKDKLEMQLKPIDREQTFYKDFLLKNFDDLKQDEKDKLTQIIAERDKIKADITAKETVARTALETALKNNVKIPDAAVQEISENPGQAYQILARYGISLQSEKERLEIQKLRNELNPSSSTFVANNPQVSPYFTAIQNASLGLPENQRKENQTRMQAYLQQGDMKSARELLIRTAFAGQTGTQKEDTIKRQNAIDALGTIKSALDEYVAVSGDTNIVSGNIQKLQQKLGTAGDPTLAAINTKITLALQQYRNAVTGAAWGEQETDEYEQIFPSYKNTNKLNGAIIDAMVESMGAFQEGTLGAYIGSDTYNTIFNGQTSAMGGATTVQGVSDDEAYQLYLRETGQAPQDNPSPEAPAPVTQSGYRSLSGLGSYQTPSLGSIFKF